MQVGFWWRRISDPGRGGTLVVEVKPNEMPIQRFYVEFLREFHFIHLDDIKIDRVVFGNTAVLADRQALLNAVLSKLDQSGETTMRNNKRQLGFSLIELLIVVAIMLIVAAIAVPQMIASVQRGNETSAASNLRQVITAENHYYQQYGGFAAAAKDLSDEAGAVTTCGTGVPGAKGLGACVLQNSLGDNADAGSTGGYGYTYKATGTLAGNQGATGLGTSWYELATPLSSFKGAKSFCADSSGNVVYSPGTTALTPANGICPAVDNTAVFNLGS